MSICKYIYCILSFLSMIYRQFKSVQNQYKIHVLFNKFRQTQLFSRTCYYGKKLDTFWNVLEEISLERKEAISLLTPHPTPTVVK